MNCSSWGTSESRSLSLEVDFLPQQCHRSKTLSFQFQEQDSSSIHSGQSSTVEMSVQHSSIGSTLGTTEGCVIRSFMQNQDFTFPPPLLDQSQTLAHYADPGYSNLMSSSYGPQSKTVEETAPIRIPLQLDVKEEPIYVNSKQYHAILRRRLYRAKLEVQNKPIKYRKPYLHESRHLHAVKRARGAGGRFLNTKKLQQSTRKHGNTAESNMHQIENYRDGDNATYASNSGARNMQNYTSDKGGGGTTQHPLFVYM
ncbi:nuclear transcription factor Y subunit A-8-like isoform X1 [Vigna unguiculata]|uniref:nuclear transcription factor Y subunit A-8-like isoform X1 n=1 Tax=Vigna unguiculata TaxID=3917 RepID=UPI001016AED6|nr:nuclear transcription factor Y subunit A-8-like isoform X1 [Vigna unguiculata]